MKRQFLTVVVLVLLSRALAQAPDIEWQRNFGGSAIDIGRNVILNSQGSLLISSIANSTDVEVPLHTHARGHWLKSVDLAGELEWSEVIGYVTGGNVRSLGLQELTGQNGYWAGVTVDPMGEIGCVAEGFSHIWLGRLDPAGAVIEEICLGGTQGDTFSRVQMNGAEELFIVGSTFSDDGDVSGNHGLADILALKLNSAGEVLWSKCFGGSASDGARNFIITTDGGLLVSGITRSNDQMLEGVNPYPTFYSSAWVLKLAEDGEIIWQQCYGGENQDVIMAMGEYSNGDIWAAGFTRSTTDLADCNMYDNDAYWVMRIDSQGEVLQRACYGGSTGDQLEDALLLPDDRLLLIGHTSSTDGDVSYNHGGKDVWLVQLNSDLSLMWEKTYGGSGHDYAYSATLTPDGGVVLVGESSSSDGDLTGNHGLADVWVVKLAPWINVGVEEEEDAASSIHVYPNPANELLQVILPGGTNGTAFLKIYDPIGSLVLEHRTGGSQTRVDLPIEKLAGGAYVLEYTNGMERHAVQFIKL